MSMSLLSAFSLVTFLSIFSAWFVISLPASVFASAQQSGVLLKIRHDKS